MYNIIEEEEPNDFSTQKYLYFDDAQDDFIQDHLFGADEFMNNLDLENMNNQDFSNLINNSDLSSNSKQACQVRFQKAKRIQKREKAKTRLNTPHLNLLQTPGTEASEILISKLQTEHHYSKEEEQKRKKRISAQTSRDKKKLYVQHIERQNEELKQKCKLLQAENQRLQFSSKTPKPVPQKKTSLKSWFIMSLILFSLQKQSEWTNRQSSIPYQLQYSNSGYLFDNAKNLLIQYEKQPLYQKFIDLQQFKDMAGLSEEDSQKIKRSIIQGQRIKDVPEIDINRIPQKNEWVQLVKTQESSF